MTRIIFLFISVLAVSCSAFKKNAALEKVYVVEREREALTVIKNETESKKISNLGNLNHATIKFRGDFAFVLARDGYISKIDTKNDVLIKKVKVGQSGIGITFIKKHLAMVNYDPLSVIVLDEDLNVIKTIETDSRNVGVKSWNNFLVFSLMDKNEIWVLDADKNYELVKTVKDVGELPFDALIKDHIYIVGLFSEGSVGVFDLKTFHYHKISMKDSSGGVVFKVPHFGYWGVVGDEAVVPLSGNKSLLVIDLKKMQGKKEIALPGNPVFASVSPDKKFLSINYSGEEEDLISVFRTSDWSKVADINAGRRVMHLRYSLSHDALYVSSYFENKVHILSTKTWEKIRSIPVSTPSGIFLEDGVDHAK